LSTSIDALSVDGISNDTASEDEANASNDTLATWDDITSDFPPVHLPSFALRKEPELVVAILITTTEASGRKQPTNASILPLLQAQASRML